MPGAGVIDSRSGVSGQALRLGGWDESQFLEFQFTIAPNTALTLDGLNFAERFGGVGGGAGGGGGSPQTFTGWNFLVDGVEQASGAASAPGGADPFETVSQPLSVGGLSGLVTIRLTADGPFVPGSWFIDNFELTGTFAPVPLPPAAWLFGSALVGLAARRRRAA